MKPRAKRILFTMLGSLIVCLVVGVSGEMLVRFFDPQSYLYPRLQYSEEYGSVLFKNRRMVNALPGRYEFIYTVNEFGYRGPALHPDSSDKSTNIIVLGDSFGFGIGVADGEEFSAVIKRHLGRGYEVINLSVPGYGLTQEIRRYVEFGRLFHPAVVVIQFCANDPTDNLLNRVTEVDGTSFTFHKTSYSAGWVKDYLSDSFVQQSQLYNFFRGRFASIFEDRAIVDARINLGGNALRRRADTISVEEEFYCRLFETFVRMLSQEGKRILMISVNGQMDQFPFIRQKVRELHKAGHMEYVEVLPWFEGVRDYASPEGHGWGAPAHALIGQHLAEIIASADVNDSLEFADRSRTGLTPSTGPP